VGDGRLVRVDGLLIVEASVLDRIGKPANPYR
jgi:hypothetical protein